MLPSVPLRATPALLMRISIWNWPVPLRDVKCVRAVDRSSEMEDSELMSPWIAKACMQYLEERDEAVGGRCP